MEQHGDHGREISNSGANNSTNGHSHLNGSANSSANGSLNGSINGSSYGSINGATNGSMNGSSNSHWKHHCEIPDMLELIPEEEDGEQTSDSNGDSPGEDKPHKLTRSEILTFICLVIGTFISWLVLALMAPYFPREAHERGMSDLEVGFLFGVQAFAVFITAPIVGKFLPKIGDKVAVVVGLLIESVSNILFGFCGLVHDKVLFIVFCYLTRIMVAIGMSTSVTAIMAINANTFSEHISLTLGILEMTSGVGMLLGPVIGGALYEAGGSSFILPFVAVGCLDFASMLFSFFVLPSTESKHLESGSVLEFCKIPAMWPILLSVFAASLTMGFLDPTLSLHASHFTKNAMMVGVLFMLISACYAISSPLWGWAGDKWEIERAITVVGLVFGCVSLLLLGPSPILPLPNQLWILCFGLILLGMSDGAIIVSALTDLFKTAVKYGLPEDLKTRGVVAGVFNGTYSLGFMFGPWAAGGFLFQAYGFDITASILSVLLLTAAFLLSTFTLGENFYWKRQRGRNRDHTLIRTEHAVPETTLCYQQSTNYGSQNLKSD